MEKVAPFRRPTGIILAAVSAVCYAIMPLLAKAAYRLGTSPFDLLALRFLFAAVIFWSVSLSLRRQAMDIGRHNAFLSGVAGILFGLAAMAMFIAYRRLDASLAVILLYTHPPLIALLNRIFHHEWLGAVGVLALGSAFLGVILAVEGPFAGSGIDPYGVAAALAGSILYAIYSLVGQRLVSGTGALAFSTWSVTATLVLVSAVSSPLGAWRRADEAVIWIAAMIALVCTFLAIYTFAAAVKLVGATMASTVGNLEPVMVVILSGLVLGERLGQMQAVGGILIFLGVWLIHVRPAAVAREREG